jgi:hypothetical protein
MSGQGISPRPGAVAVDPPGCGCTECLTGEYVPLEQATDAQVAALLTGSVGNNTGLRFTVVPCEPGTVRVVPLFAEDGTPVAGNAPDEPGWHLVEAGWNLDARHFTASPLDPGLAAPAPPLAPAVVARIRAGLARYAASAAGEDSLAQAGPGGCACPGRAEGRHDLACEHVLRGAYGSVADAPEEVKQLLRARNRLVTGTVVTPGEPGSVTARDLPRA